MGYFAKYKNNGIGFMDKSTKANTDELVDREWHLFDYGFIKSKESDGDDFAVAQFEEDMAHFYFMNSIFTSILHETEKDFDYDKDKVLEQFKNARIAFSKKVSSKSGREYMACDFIEE